MTDYTSLLVALQELQGQITLDKRHCYRKDGKLVPGVTTIIKVMDAPALDAWKVRVQVEGTARAAHDNPPVFGEDKEEYVSRLVEISKEQFEHERIANQAADIGTQVHALIEHAVKTQLGQPVEPPVVTDEALFIFAGWREWAEKVGLKPLMAEGRVWHPMGYCGTFDLLALVGARPAICDWKPTPRIYPERRLQLSAYCEALIEMGWPELDRYVVSLPRDGGEIEAVSLDGGSGFGDPFGAFGACLNLYQWQRYLQRAERKEVEAA